MTEEATMDTQPPTAATRDMETQCDTETAMNMQPPAPVTSGMGLPCVPETSDYRHDMHIPTRHQLKLYNWYKTWLWALSGPQKTSAMSCMILIMRNYMFDPKDGSDGSKTWYVPCWPFFYFIFANDPLYIAHTKTLHFSCIHYHFIICRVLHTPVGAAIEWVIVQRFSYRLAARKWLIESETKF